MIPRVEQLAKFLSTGELKSNRFKVIIIGHGWNKDFTAVRVNVPNLNITFEEQFLNDRFVFAPKELQSQDLQITFIDNSKREVYTFFFERIFDMCFNFETPRLRKFHDDIKFEKVKIYPLDISLTPQRANVFEDVVPYQVNDINFDAGSDDMIYTVVNFKYAFHKLE